MLQSTASGDCTDRGNGRACPSAAPASAQILSFVSSQGRQVVAAACLNKPLDRARLRQVRQQALGRFLVLGEAPKTPEVGQEGCEPALRSGRKAVGPALLRDFRCVAFGHRPGTRRIHDHGALAGNQPLVVRGVVPGRRHRAAGSGSASCRYSSACRTSSVFTVRSPLALTSSRTKRLEDRPGRIHAVSGLAKTDPEG